MNLSGFEGDEIIWISRFEVTYPGAILGLHMSIGGSMAELFLLMFIESNILLFSFFF